MTYITWKLACDRPANLSDMEYRMIAAIGVSMHMATLSGVGSDPSPEALRSCAEVAAETMADLFPEMNFRAERGVAPD